jgi:hypothetical protein
MMNVDDECAKWSYNWGCYMNVVVEVKCSWWFIENWTILSKSSFYILIGCQKSFYILIMIDVILTSSGFDRLPVCMDG